MSDDSSQPQPVEVSPLQDQLQRLMAWYERFEQIVAFILGLIITVVIVMALIQLIKNLLPLILGGALDPQDHMVFQTLFGMIIALIALSRKFVILDPETDPCKIVAMTTFNPSRKKIGYER